MSETPAESPEVAALIPGLIAAQRAELRRRRLWVVATRCVSLGLAAWYLEMLIIEGKDDPFYISVNLAALVVGVSMLVVFNYFDPPLLVRNLHGPDGPLRRASFAALGPLRGLLLPSLLQDLGVAEPERERLVAGIDADDLVRRTAARMQGDRRRFGRIYLAIVLPLLLGFIVLVATHEAVP
jgi:hypothetical protein